MSRSRLLIRLGDRDEGGFALVVVIALTAVTLGLIAVITVSAQRSLTSSRAHSNFEGSLAAAETGIDSTLSTINAAFNNGVTYTSPSPCSVTAPSATFTSDTQERTWARDALLGLPASCLVTTPDGQYVAVRPTNRQAVYAMGWSPSMASASAKRRLVKAEYLFSPYKPSNAVLTGGGLNFSGSVAVNTVGAATSADVHANQSISGISGSTQIQGAVSASGSLLGGCGSGVTGGCTAAAPLQTIPAFTARGLYTSQVANYPNNWYDLCPDGTVRVGGPNLGSDGTITPCLGALAADNRGWTFTAGSGTTAPLWTLPRTAGGPFPGVYYAYDGDAQIGDTGNSSVNWNITVLAEAKAGGSTDPSTCYKLGGNISWKLFNLTPYMSGVQMVADADLTGDANDTAGTGLFYAGDAINLNTSSATLTGAVIAANSCAAAGTNTIQGVTINFDQTFEAPLSDIIRTSLWLEYPSG